MLAHKERFIVDKDGNRVGVVLEISDYQHLLADEEELESIRAYDSAKNAGETPVPFEQAVSDVERRRR